jgi:hypothetical protein
MRGALVPMGIWLDILNELVHSFPWESGLKRNVEWKRKRITDQLHSMIAAALLV